MLRLNHFVDLDQSNARGTADPRDLNGVGAGIESDEHGGVGQRIGQFLHAEKTPFVALDLDPRSVTVDAPPSGKLVFGNAEKGGVLKAALVSTLLGIGSEFGSGSDSDLARALRRGSQDSVNRAGEQIVSRELNIRPTLTIRPGFPVRVLVTRDIVLESGS